MNWFYRIDFGGNSNYNDGLWYEGWEGCFDWEPEPGGSELPVRQREGLIDEFGIDGLRLDVAYSLDENFVRSAEVTGACSIIGRDASRRL